MASEITSGRGVGVNKSRGITSERRLITFFRLMVFPGWTKSNLATRKAEDPEGQSLYSVLLQQLFCIKP